MNYENIINNAITVWLSEAIDDWESLDNPEWIEHVCNETGLTEEDYRRIILEVDGNA